VRRLDFTIGLLLAAAMQSAQAQERAKQRRIAIVVPAGPVARISDAGDRFGQAIFEEFRQLGDVEGQNLTVERYSGEGRPEGYADLARGVVNRNPDVIVAITDAIAKAVRAAAGTTPIVWVGGDPIQAGLATSLPRPGGNITGVTVYVGIEIWGKRLQILKEAVPSASKAAFLTTRTSSAFTAEQLREISRGLEITLIDIPLHEATPSELRRVFAEIPEHRPDAIMVSSIGDLVPYRQLIVELVEKSRLPAMYPWRDYMDVGGLMAYASDLGEIGRRLADDAHQILNGTKPGDIPDLSTDQIRIRHQSESRPGDRPDPPARIARVRRRAGRMRRRDVTAGLLLAAAAQSLRAQEPAKQRRIAIVIPAGPITSISDTGVRAWRAFFEELRRSGDVEGQNLTIERYSGEGRPEGYG
jgi:putative tryptophan/tyrosine transport system substrate-binding protein